MIKISSISPRHITVSPLAFSPQFLLHNIINNSKGRGFKQEYFSAHYSVGHQFAMGGSVDLDEV